MKFLDVTTINPNPIEQFKRWFEEAQIANVPMPEAMTLSTVSADDKPSARMVLLKEVNEQRFIFFTNYLSRKGMELELNRQAALVFYWQGLERQVRIEGTVERTSEEASDAYYQTRPRDSQLSAIISPQSKMVTGREELERLFEEAKLKFEGKAIPRPKHWGGYCVTPNRIEFWQGREGRLHDRVEYCLLEDGSWLIQRLAP